MKSRALILAWVLVWGGMGSGAYADDTSDPAPIPAQKAPRTKKNSKINQKKGHRVVKETEGTEAPNRFEADTVIKSQYELDGQPLEVDPD